MHDPELTPSKTTPEGPPVFSAGRGTLSGFFPITVL